MHIRRPLCVFCLLFVLVLAAISTATGISIQPHDKELDGLRLEFKGTIKQIEHKNNNLILHIENIFLADGTGLDGNVLMYIPDRKEINEQIHIGTEVGAVGEFNDFRRAYNRGQFDLSLYRALRGYMYAVYDGRVLTVSRSYNRLTDGLYRIRERTKGVYEHYFVKDDHGVLEALVLADKGNLDEDLKDRYSDAGIGHILALSGLHIATIGFILMNLLRRLKLPLWVACSVSSVLMMSYCLMTGMPLSAVRALIMYFIAIGAVLLKRSVDLRTSAALACLIMLVINPDRLYDASFLMSFSAVVGIGLVYPFIRELVLNVLGRNRIRILKRSDRRIVRLGMGLLSSLLLSLSIQLAILPFTMWFYYRISLYGVFINLIVIPLAGILLMLAVTIGVLGSFALYVRGLYDPLDRFVRCLSYITHLILRFYDLLTEGVNRIPGAVLVTGRPKMWQMILYYAVLSGVLAFAAYLVHRLKTAIGRIRRKEPSQAAMAGKDLIKYMKVRSLAALIVCLAAFALLFVRIQPAFEISSLYVGQGQCFVIHGRGLPTIMYDCGSTDEKKLGEYTLAPFLECLKLDRVDTVFISHLDTDHVSGLLDLLSNDNSHIRIERIVISADPVQKTSENYESLLDLANLRGIPVCSMRVGDSMKWKRVRVECMWPGGKAEHLTPAADLNDGSLVLSLEYDGDSGRSKLRALFTGDISSDVEDTLVPVLREKGAGISGYDILQVAHHGSASSANENFIKTVFPGAAIISAGINNRYGHPQRETLDILRKNRIPVLVTSECGETDIREGRGGAFSVVTDHSLQ